MSSPQVPQGGQGLPILGQGCGNTETPATLAGFSSLLSHWEREIWCGPLPLLATSQNMPVMALWIQPKC